MQQELEEVRVIVREILVQLFFLVPPLLALPAEAMNTGRLFAPRVVSRAFVELRKRDWAAPITVVLLPKTS